MSSVKLPTKEEMLATPLPVEVHGVSETPSGEQAPVVYRYATEDDARDHLKAERALLQDG